MTNRLDAYPSRYRRYSGREKTVQWLWTVACAVAVVWAMRAIDVEWAFLGDAHIQALDMAERMWPPRWSYAQQIWQPLVETIHIATLGTMAAVVLAIPVAFIAARNTAGYRPVWFVGRLILILSRSINTVIWGLLFVAIFGPGPIAGICAVTARSTGFIAKLVAEAIEEVDYGQIEAVEATGASKLQVLASAIWPQVQPVLIGTSIYRWDINVREASVLGFVGAGGIGLQLNASINEFAWNQVLLILCAILVLVIVSEFVSARVRAKVS
ncbi:phosphonate ABC transporter, permease protein PhnE [Aquamicrobium segne]|uniref:Phosphonate ABC transporter, permease protein PhnE n=1 Tax=Aquamicrobium segne TaxID=469547 RepID=A0ABW0H0B9_9HYPH